MSWYDRGLMSLAGLFTGVEFGLWQDSYAAGLCMSWLCFFIAVVVASQYEDEP